MILFSALVLAADSGSQQATRRAVGVQQLRPAYDGPSALVAALKGGDARGRALARADLDADGAPDLVAGYAWNGAGIVTIQRGNKDAFAPKRRAVLERMQRGFDPAWVAADAGAVRVPEPVSYLEAGDFNDDRRPDVLAAARGGGLYLLAGDGKGGVGQAERVPLPGPVTTVAAGEFRAADGHPDVAVGVTAPKGPELLLYDGAAAGKPAKPMRFPLPGSATALRFGSLDPDPYMDLAVAAGGRVEIVHGWGREHSPSLESRVERLAKVSGVRGLSIGYFLRDRAGRNEIAAAFSDGTVRLLTPNELDTRPPTAKTIRLRAAARANARRVKPRETESQPAWRSSTASGWDLGQAVARGAGGALPQNLLTNARVSAQDTEDLLVADGVRGLELVRAGEKAPRKVAAALTKLNAAVDAPTAVLPMPPKANGVRGIVVVDDDGASATVVSLVPQTIVVDRTDDPSGAALTAASACTAAANDCSLRGAVQFANANVDGTTTTISLGANTYTLSINGANGCINETPVATGNTRGDLELNRSTTIIGVSPASTIIRQTGTGDRVMCLNALFLVGLQYNFSGLTITGGREASGFGGGGIIGGELSNSLTLDNVRVSNNQVNNAGIGGGGVQITGGDLNITNSTFGGTNAPGADRNDVTLANHSQTSGGAVMYTPSSPMHAGGTGVMTISSSTFTRNTAGSICCGGGAIDIVQLAFAAPGGTGSGTTNISTSTFSNNQAPTANGGAIIVETLGATITTSTFTSNSVGNRGGAIYCGGGSGVHLDGTNPGITMSGNTATIAGSAVSTSGPVSVSGTNVTLGGSVEVTTNGTWTNNAGSAMSPTDLTVAGGTFNANNSTTNVGGNFTFNSGTFNSGTGVFNFNGSGAQSINGPASPTFNTLQVNKTAGSTLTLNVNTPVKSDLTVGSGILDLGAFTANRTAAGGTLTVSNGATLKIGGTNSLPTNYAAYALGPSSTVEYSGSGAQTITATNYGHLTSTSTGARTLPSGQTVGVAGHVHAGHERVHGHRQHRELQRLRCADDPGVRLQQPDEQLDGRAHAGLERHRRRRRDVHAGHERLHGDRQHRELQRRRCADDPGVRLQQPDEQLDGRADARLERHGRRRGDVHAGHERVHGDRQHGRLQRRGCADDPGVRLQQPDQQLDGGAHAGVERHDRRGWELHAGHERIHGDRQHRELQRRRRADDPGVRLQQPHEQLDRRADAGCERHVGVAGTFTPGTNAYTVTGSTVDFNGAGAQTIPAFAYNNLTSSSTGARTLASSGTIGVAGTFTPGTNAYTVTGSTVDFNGAGAQTIPAFGYNNLTSSSTGARTLAASGTVGVAGTFTPGTNAYTVTGSTVNFNGVGRADDPGVRLQQPDEQLDGCADASVGPDGLRRRRLHAGHQRVHGDRQHRRLQRLGCADDPGVRLQQPDEQLDRRADAGLERHDRRGRGRSRRARTRTP